MLKGRDVLCKDYDVLCKQIMIIHVTSYDDFYSLDIMFYDYKNMFTEDSFTKKIKVLRKTSL